MRNVWCIILFVQALHKFSLSQSIPDSNHQIVKNGLLNFGIKLNSILLENNTENKNLLFSPYNLYTALALVHLGSNGTTRDEISNVLGIPKTFSSKSLHEILQNFSSVAQSSFDLSAFENGTEVNVKAADLKLINGIFVQQDTKLKRAYVEDVQLYHNSEVFNVDFAKKREETKDIINKYIANKTENRIPRLFEKSLSEDTLMVLTSSLYFKSVWLEKFSEALTKESSFYTDKGSVTVQMMQNIINALYAKISSLGVEVVNLKFADNAFSMFIVKPYENHPLEKYLRNLTAENISAIVNQTNEPYNVDIQLPKTAFKWSKSVKNELIQLGLKAETLNAPNLSNMLEEDRNIVVDDIRHSTDIKINEDGTEASAVSILAMTLRSDLCFKLVRFHVNRPFFFFIYNHKINTVLFFGTVYYPNSD